MQEPIQLPSTIESDLLAARSRPTAPNPLRVALWAAAQGWHVHPLTPGTKIPVRGCDRCSPGTKQRPNRQYTEHDGHACPCVAAGRPCHGVLAATNDPSLIVAWWNRLPAAGVGIAAGPSGLVILDVDSHEGDAPVDPEALLPGVDLPYDIAPGSVADGRDTLALLVEARRATLPGCGPETLTVHTPSGGVHYWFRAPAGTTWRPLAGALGWQLDVRAGSSYAVAPGTSTRAGAYTALGDCRTVAELPVWLARDLDRTGHRVRPERPRTALPWRSHTVGGGYVAAAIEGELRAVAEAQAGTRNETLNRAAFNLGTLRAVGQLDRAQLADVLRDAARHAGLPDREAEAAIRSGLSAGERYPRTLTGAAA
ncbi:bifunctional DNA primase/polymerase [Streptomyces sp. NBC_00335]|uniref:bifunctional DNA primase/polymerase n=1 Tax=unclassified Streptomyces TaxID=2593676 RepID=UPI00224E3ED1|nr:MULTISPECIES: bifunctional DNA primase/polymerase [unclassified Streptomyces]MCX5406175.1 bifunctional DNA primase/polymerase [Streptomyces sp. NBC_00086]